jgi:4'-phosphopantetheinyl transferase EntD
MNYWMVDEQNQLVGENPPTFLHTDETGEFLEIKNLKRSSEWLHGRWAAKNLLKKYHPDCTSSPLSEIIIKNGETGAPYATLPTGRKLSGSLSISHKEALAASALVLECQARIGIDLERIESRPVTHFEAYLTSNELDALKTCRIDDQPEFLTLLWSAKESVSKAIGSRFHNPKDIEIKVLFEERKTDWDNFEILVSFNRECPINGFFWRGWWKVYQNNILTIALARQIDFTGQSQRHEILVQYPD